MVKYIKPLIVQLTSFAKNRLGFNQAPKLFLKKDIENQKSILGKTAHYDPQNKAITIFISGRHPKDILRSYCHELVHHCQNERGDLSFDKMKTLSKNYAQENDHMRKMEKEAYLEGNLCFRDWEDGLSNKTQYKMNIAEQKFFSYKRRNKMKLTKKILEQKIRKILLEKKVEKPVKEEGNDAFAPSHYCIHHGGVQHEGAIHQGEAIGHNWNEELGKVTHYDMKLADGTILEDVAEEDILVTKASLAEGSYTLVGECSHKRHGIKRKKDKEDLEENEEIEESFPDLTGDGKVTQADILKARGVKLGDDDDEEEEKKKKTDESKIQTPEQEEALYEQRFTKKNTKLFERLLKEWTK